MSSRAARIGIAVTGSGLLARRWYLRWGATDEEYPEIGLEVAEVEPGRALVLRGGIPMGPVPAPYDFSWAVTLRECLDGTTRLVVRERYSYSRWWSAAVVEPVEAVSAVMSQRMLRGIRDRAERTPASGPAASMDHRHKETT